MTTIDNIAMSAAKQAPEAKEPGGKDADDQFAAPKAANVTSSRKEPPPEKPESIRLRYLVLLSFWAIIILLGLPIWWATTSIYRAPLPMEQMMDWADGKVCGAFRRSKESHLTAAGL
jgi:phosphatidylinositol glycan class S